MNIEVLENADSVAERAAGIIAERARAAVAARGRFVMAVSGGHTPWLMLRRLAADHVPWSAVHVVQVDERVAPAGHPDRNLTHLRESLLDHSRCLPASFIRCRSNRRIWKSPQRNTPRLSGRLLDLHPCSTSSTWGWDLTATRLHWCPAIQFWISKMPMSH